MGAVEACLKAVPGLEVKLIESVAAAWPAASVIRRKRWSFARDG